MFNQIVILQHFVAVRLARMDTIFSEQDNDFLKRMFEVYPRIGANFSRYTAMPAGMRVDAAISDTKVLLRAGWVARQVKNPESVYDHGMRLGKWIETLAFPASIDREHMKLMSEVHDLPEAIVTDFTPLDGITHADKEKLESLAARIVFTADPKKTELVDEYIAQKTKESHVLHDLDKLDAVRQALVYEGYYPEKIGRLYSDFRKYAWPRLKTETGRAIAESLATNADQIRSDSRQQFLAAKTHSIVS